MKITTLITIGLLSSLNSFAQGKSVLAEVTLAPSGEVIAVDVGRVTETYLNVAGNHISRDAEKDGGKIVFLSVAK